MNYLCALFESTAIVSIIYGLEQERKKFDAIKTLIFVVAFMLLFSLINLGIVGVELSFVEYILLFLYVKWTYSESVFRTLSIVVIGLVIVSLLEFIMINVIANFFTTQNMTNHYKVVVTLLALMCTILISKLKICRLVNTLGKWDFAYVIVCLLSLMIFTPVAVLKIINKLDVTDYLYIVFCIVVMWFLLYRIQKYKIEDKIRKEYIAGYSKVISQIRKRQHKIKNQINAAYGMFQLFDNYEDLVENQKQYLSSILKYELPNDAIVLEEPSVIALIYEKINEAIDLGIDVESSFQCSMENHRVSDVVWVDIIGTLFDNAIEALCDYEGDKKIWIEIRKKKDDKIEVKVENTFSEMTITELSRFFELGYSTKGDERGLGLANIKEQVNRYHGNISVMNSGEKCVNTIVFIVII